MNIKSFFPGGERDESHFIYCSRNSSARSERNNNSRLALVVMFDWIYNHQLEGNYFNCANVNSLAPCFHQQTFLVTFVAVTFSFSALFFLPSHITIPTAASLCWEI
jgi:hypothetical protein